MTKVISLEEDVKELAHRAYEEMDDVSDFIWKSPRLITHETRLEKEKLEEYFPNGGPTAWLRWKYESRKLTETFPNLIAAGNLFSATSTFEIYVLRLLRLLEKHQPKVGANGVSRGITRHLKVCQLYGAKPAVPRYYEQVNAIISIRNCLMHAGGLLSSSREGPKLKALIGAKQFLDPSLRSRRVVEKSSFSYEVEIQNSELGERLIIKNTYSHLASFYLREYFVGLCKTVVPIPSIPEWIPTPLKEKAKRTRSSAD